MTTSDLVFACVVVKEAKGFTALCLDLDVASNGASPAKAKKALREAVELYLDTAFESNLPHLRPVPKEEDPRSAAPDSIVESFDMKVGLKVQAHA